MFTLSKRDIQFCILFFIIVVLELICSNSESLLQVHYVTKPAIVITLMLFFWKRSGFLNQNIRLLTVLALLFSVIGDVLLMFVSQSEHYFMLGLISFLLAHIMYCLVFYKHYTYDKSILIFILCLGAFAYSIFDIFSHQLDDLYVPVLIYMMVLSVMVIMAASRQNSVNRLSFALVFIGAILFLSSDTILALNKFNHPISHSHWSIMLTYALAQFCIVLGLLKLSKSPR